MNRELQLKIDYLENKKDYYKNEAEAAVKASRQLEEELEKRNKELKTINDQKEMFTELCRKKAHIKRLQGTALMPHLKVFFYLKQHFGRW